MELIKPYIKYIFLLLSIVLIGIFIYPTLYKYDKLEQKYPVKINRITGEASILTSKGWVDTSGYNAAVEEIKLYKNEIQENLGNLQNSIREDIIREIKDDVIYEVEAELALVKKEIASYKQHEVDPNSYFTIGSSKEEVKKIMGVPTSTLNLPTSEIWYYEMSSITFKNNKVAEYSNHSKNLRVR